MIRATATGLLVLLLLGVPVVAAAPPAAGEAAGEEATAEGTSELLFKAINFAFLLAALYYLRRPLMNFLFGYTSFEDERQAIRSAIDQAEQQRRASEARLREIEQRLKRLDEKVAEMSQEARENAAAERERIQQAAQQESERILATTRAEIDSAGRAARLELRAYAARLAVNLAVENIRQELTAERHTALFQASLDEMAGHRREGRA